MVPTVNMCVIINIFWFLIPFNLSDSSLFDQDVKADLTLLSYMKEMGNYTIAFQSALTVYFFELIQ